MTVTPALPTDAVCDAFDSWRYLHPAVARGPVSDLHQVPASSISSAWGTVGHSAFTHDDLAPHCMPVMTTWASGGQTNLIQPAVRLRYHLIVLLSACTAATSLSSAALMLVWARSTASAWHLQVQTGLTHGFVGLLNLHLLNPSAAKGSG
jgi:hypothetical protein